MKIKALLWLFNTGSIISGLVGVCLAAPAGLDPDEVVQVGLVQMNAKTFDKDYNLAQAEEGIRRAAARGAQIICTPEVTVQGYPRISLPKGTSADDPDIAAERARIIAAAEPISRLTSRWRLEIQAQRELDDARTVIRAQDQTKGSAL